MLYNFREDYQSEDLDTSQLDRDPVNQFHHWFQDVIRAGISDPNAMTLATCTPDGRPSARMVLLKDYSEAGFTFFTNYESRKGWELRSNPHASLVFFWRELNRQIRVEGTVEKLPEEDSAAYFKSRPRDSQVGAWASPQSREIPNREVLNERFTDIRKQYDGEESLPLPPFWGGFLVRPDTIEFWQGQPSRLHDRFYYSRGENGLWEVVRLAP